MTTTTTQPTLRPYQRAQLDAIAKGLQGGLRRMLVQASTGTGKTVSLAAIPDWPPIRAWLQQFHERERKMLVIAHREELLEQAADKIQKANPGHWVSIEQGARYASAQADVIVASIQTLSARKCQRLRELQRRHRFRIVVYDECHHCASPTARNVLTWLGFLPPSDNDGQESAQFDDAAVMEAVLKGWDAVAPQDQFLVGYTATPNRSDAVGLGAVFQEIVHQYPIRQAVTDQWLVPITPWIIETQSDLDAVRTTHGEFNQKDLATAVNTPHRNQMAVAAWRQYAEGLSTIAFTVDVQHAHDLADTFAGAGISAVALSGVTPPDERRRILRAFTAGEIQLVANAQLLTEGVDLPRATCVLMAKPTKSATAYTQMVGRVLRPYPGKTAAIVIDCVDVARRHSLQSAAVLYGLPPNLSAKGKSLDQLADEWEAFREQYPGLEIGTVPKTLEELLAKARTFDIWSVPAMGDYGAGLTMRWIRLGEETFRLAYPWNDGTETLTVSKDLLGRFSVEVARKASVALIAPPGPIPGGPVVLAQGVVTASAALQLAEAFLQQERRTVMRLKDQSAPWRSRPASEKQLALLRRLRIPVNGKMTAGQASDAIDVSRARGTR